ncbi:DNA-binding MarR family transcriptional regulator [Sphingomonas jinjuensis]|uniref:DNA-binding MarR family transcriptional regulator n=1 Tax=Sphingomonas jinjuensis TaxID=535907 RepID=A0A840FGI8_9SPHN|nr:winged helix DNA-binding protein [Sphingomonas jinjuensis]MBB4154834.1 DNA-binding MarR family transcriptional regulator [Sphingomonas jinjuensis]
MMGAATTMMWGNDYRGDDGGAVVVIGADGGDAGEAMTLVGARIAATLGWENVADGLDTVGGGAPVLVVEAEGIDEDLLAAALPRIDGHASALDLHVVVSLGRDQIDLVASHLLGRRVALLCEPSISERVVALTVALGGTGAATLDDSVRENEAERLKRLNEEVARIADLLARLSRDTPSPATEVEDRRQRFDPGPVGIEEAADPAEVRRIIRTRRLRDQFFGANLFEDPAWDMLLDLYAAELERTRVSVSSLCIAAAVAPTTALRWITKLTEAGLFVRQPDPTDRRRAFMALTPRASEAMRRYLVAARRAPVA